MFEVNTVGTEIAYKRGTDVAKEKANFNASVAAQNMCRISGILNLPKVNLVKRRHREH